MLSHRISREISYRAIAKSSKAIMGRVSTFISKARNPIGAFAKFFFCSKNFANFCKINENLHEERR